MTHSTGTQTAHTVATGSNSREEMPQLHSYLIPKSPAVASNWPIPTGRPGKSTDRPLRAQLGKEGSTLDLEG